MPWSTEAIIAFITLLATFPPSALLIWTYFKRRLRGHPLLFPNSPAVISNNFFFSSFSRNITFSYTGDPNALLESEEYNLENIPIPVVPNYPLGGMIPAERRLTSLPRQN
ncbi:hypothetical protein ASPVEDRAFT_392510 [Aspergillus versicolor CBS 583.65]|uniref:Uncharacterized protein n=1 Tax=Aspergillus versicolor CBS 583.65 TaxID=1036611 RepID=A0A1L9Q3B1_ASPVE|nr:uncharacterized protein ASPVEDRAFT_392510 [Aspergillus versicolor CBS 583.65]OJJ08253.1 hypothetical protein ASPVEDRAFT_392510 [Aspergillus versicolor CBS 583.65]